MGDPATSPSRSPLRGATFDHTSMITPPRAQRRDDVSMAVSPGEATRLKILQSKYTRVMIPFNSVYIYIYVCVPMVMLIILRPLYMAASIMGRAGNQTRSSPSPPRARNNGYEPNSNQPLSPEIHSPQAAATLRGAESPEHVLG